MAARHKSYDHIVRSFAHLPAPILKSLNTGVQLADAFEAQKRELVNSGRLTASGVKEALANHAKEPIASLYQARRAVLSVKKQAVARRAEIKPTIKNPEDVAAALDRQEIRRVVREAKDPTAILQAGDPRILEAILTAPPVLSGIPATLHSQLLDQFATATAGADIEEISALENAADAVLAALSEIRGELREVIGLEVAPFNQLAAAIEAKATAPWLRRKPGSDEVRVVDLERGVERQPTPEELSNGIEAATLDEFNARKAA